MLIIVTYFLLSIVTPAVSEPDQPLVQLAGKILDARTQEPLHAKMTYRLVPSGNTTGIRNFANEDGSYQVTLQPHRQYRLEISSKDYLPLSIVVETDTQSRIPQDLLLQKIPQPGEVVETVHPLLFDRNQATLNEEALQGVEELKHLLNTYPSMVIQLEGHTDKGSARHLMKLSEQRAETVKDQLIAWGIHKRRIKTRSFGKSKMIARDRDAQNRQMNRRVEVKVLKL